MHCDLMCLGEGVHCDLMCLGEGVHWVNTYEDHLKLDA